MEWRGTLSFVDEGSDIRADVKLNPNTAGFFGRWFGSAEVVPTDFIAGTIRQVLVLPVGVGRGWEGRIPVTPTRTLTVVRLALWSATGLDPDCPGVRVAFPLPPFHIWYSNIRADRASIRRKTKT